MTSGSGSWDTRHQQPQPQPPSGRHLRHGSIPAPQREPVGRDTAGWSSVRCEAVLRMQRVSYNHAVASTADRPQGRLPGPHALALLFAFTEPLWDPQRPRYKLATASRMFPWTDDRRPAYNVRDSEVLLETMTRIAVTAHNAGGWDPLTITDRTEPLPPGADFVGVGLSSIGDPTMDWGKVRPTAFGLDLPTHSDIYLRDHTWIELSRGDRNSWRMTSNNDLGYLTGFEGGSRRIPIDYEPHPGSSHYWLQQLTIVVDRAYREPRTTGRK